jgi:hypothetical protein
MQTITMSMDTEDVFIMSYTLASCPLILSPCLLIISSCPVIHNHTMRHLYHVPNNIYHVHIYFYHILGDIYVVHGHVCHVLVEMLPYNGGHLHMPLDTFIMPYDTYVHCIHIRLPCSRSYITYHERRIACLGWIVNYIPVYRGILFIFTMYIDTFNMHAALYKCGLYTGFDPPVTGFDLRVLTPRVILTNWSGQILPSKILKFHYNLVRTCSNMHP